MVPLRQDRSKALDLKELTQAKSPAAASRAHFCAGTACDAAEMWLKACPSCLRSCTDDADPDDEAMRPNC